MGNRDLNDQVTFRTLIELGWLYDTIFTHVSASTDRLPVPVEQIQRCLTRDGDQRVYRHLAELAACALHAVFGGLPGDEVDAALKDVP
jgi:hypothetical protein